jgi:hypothetical protein
LGKGFWKHQRVSIISDGPTDGIRSTEIDWLDDDYLVFHESIWTGFWSENITKGAGHSKKGSAKAGITSNMKADRQSRMTLTGRLNDEDEQPDPQGISVVGESHHRRPSRPEMIHLKNQQYRMSMD